MDKNDIIKAAKEAIHSHYGCNDKHGCSERDYCQFVNGKNSAYDCCECGADEFNEGFVKGAEWRINSVWHKPDEQPNGMFAIIMQLDTDVEEYSFGVKELYEGTIRWAYVSDLLPERKEETK